jgi:hypothetical protein
MLNLPILFAGPATTDVMIWLAARPRLQRSRFVQTKLAGPRSAG